MRSSWLFPPVVALTSAMLACSGATPGSRDGGQADAGSDAGVAADAGPDGGPRDAGSPADAGPKGDAGWVFVATTTLASLTQNDTSGCGNDAAPCTGAWTGTSGTTDAFWDEAVSPGAQDPASSYGRVSKVPMDALLPGQSAPVWVETQNWWGGSGHIANGEDSASAAQMAHEVADQASRGISGQVADWYGPGTTADQALQGIRPAAEATDGGYRFAVMIDQGFFAWDCGNTVACLNSGLAYLAANDFPSPAYLRDDAGHPLVFFFVNSYYPASYAVLGEPGIDDQDSVFVMYAPNGFPGNDPPDTAGEFGWVNPSDGQSYTQTSGSAGKFSWESDLGFEGLSSFLSAAAANPGSYAVSEAYKGFDDALASWGTGRVIDQQCGLTWLETFDHTGSFGGSAGYQGNLNFLQAGKRLDLVMVDTWDDYEEGTEIETGIDNCLTSLGVALAGSTVSWTPTFGQDPMNSAVTGSEATVHHYSVYVAAQGGGDVMWLADVAPPTHALDVSPFGISGGPWVFFVQAVGEPSIVSTLGGPSGPYAP